MPVREKRTNGAARARHVPSLVPVYAQSAAIPRASPPTALEFTAETDSALEGGGFEPSVPLGEKGQGAECHISERVPAPRDKSGGIRLPIAWCGAPGPAISEYSGSAISVW